MIATTLEQSKKLLELGIDPNTADMCYKCIEDDPYDVICKSYSEWKEEYKGLLLRGDVNIVPCWSLAALLEIIPKRIKDYNVLRMDIADKDFAIWYDEIGYGVNTELPDITMELPVDACVEIIIQLKEKDLI